MKTKLALAVLLLTFFAQPFAARAQSAVTFTLTARSAFLRNGPGLNTARVASIFKDQTFTVIGRSTDGAWMKLDYAGVSEAWIMRALGTVKGEVSGLPVVASTAPTSVAPGATALPASGGQTTGSSRVSLTLTVKSVFARSAPSFSGARVASLFKGQTYGVTAISGDGLWVQLDLAGTGGWVMLSTGTVTGDLSGVPVIGLTPALTATPPPAPAAAAPPISGDIIAVGTRVREIYQSGLAQGNNARAFAKIGDCNSINPYFLTKFDTPQAYQLSGPYLYLQETVKHFSGSFGRESVAAQLGYSPATVLDPTWADPRKCQSGETPLACEYRRSRASIAFISLGTNSLWQTSADFEAGMRLIIEYSIQKGVVPIIVTKADNLEGDDHFNQSLIRLAGEYNVPLLNFKQAVAGLPNSGLAADNFHLVWGPPFYLDENSAQTGWQRRNLVALQALDAVWQAGK